MVPSDISGLIGSKVNLPPLVHNGLEIPGSEDLVAERVSLCSLTPTTRANTRMLQEQSIIRRGSSANSSASPVIQVSVAPCLLPEVDSVFTPSIVSTIHSSSSEGRSIRYALRSREITVEGTGGKGLPVLANGVGGKG